MRLYKADGEITIKPFTLIFFGTILVQLTEGTQRVRIPRPLCTFPSRSTSLTHFLQKVKKKTSVFRNLDSSINASITGCREKSSHVLIDMPCQNRLLSSSLAMRTPYDSKNQSFRIYWLASKNVYKTVPNQKFNTMNYCQPAPPVPKSNLKNITSFCRRKKSYPF